MEILNGLHPHYDDVANDAFSNLKYARMIDFTLAKTLAVLLAKYYVIVVML